MFSLEDAVVAYFACSWIGLKLYSLAELATDMRIFEVEREELGQASPPEGCIYSDSHPNPVAFIDQPAQLGNPTSPLRPASGFDSGVDRDNPRLRIPPHSAITTTQWCWFSYLTTNLASVFRRSFQPPPPPSVAIFPQDQASTTWELDKRLAALPGGRSRPRST
jgi:hypothetical protein